MHPVLTLLLTSNLALAAPAPAAPAEGLQSLAWLAGCWQHDNAEAGTGEQWMPLAGGTLIGTSRTIRNGRTVAHEFMQLRQREDGSVVFIALPSGQRETAFVLTGQDDNGTTFSNPDNDFPQRIIYAQRGSDRLHARIEGAHAGTPRAVDFPMHRIACAGP